MISTELFSTEYFHTEVIHTKPFSYRRYSYTEVLPTTQYLNRVFPNTTLIIHTILHAEDIHTCHIFLKNWKWFFVPWTEHFHTEHSLWKVSCGNNLCMKKLCMKMFCLKNKKIMFNFSRNVSCWNTLCKNWCMNIVLWV